ncbi:Peptidase S1C [Gracilaria domingensis]|nr:Peptidase S1C [Gracilaria domingensis]
MAFVVAIPLRRPPPASSRLSRLRRPPPLQASLLPALFNPFAAPKHPAPPAQPPSVQPAKPSAAKPASDKPLRLFESNSRKPRQNTSFVTQAVRSVGSAVVRIDTERVIRQAPNDPLFDDPQFAKIFGESPFRQRYERGQGSGFIISSDGHLLTNAHVVRAAQKVTVTLTDGRSFVGVVKGSDEYLDLAVIKIDAGGKPLPVAPMGSSSELEVGDWVIAVGNPVGLDNTVTLGIVSSLNRSAAEVGIPEKRLNLIQTSASLNQGSSGGPICNQWGEVVGISTAIRINAEAIGFAIPIDIAKEVASELARGKPIAHAYVGIRMTSITPASARQNNQDPNSLSIVPEVDGALVVRVMPKSPAANGGLRRYDVIVSIDGKKVRNAKDVQAVVDRSRVGQQVNVQVLRGESASPIQLGIKTGNLSNLKAEPPSTASNPFDQLK